VDALVINKIDLLPYVNFRMGYFERGVQVLNLGVVTFPFSCTTGEGGGVAHSKRKMLITLST
jgi:hydrogenase nickel incorporation protein HypB